MYYRNLGLLKLDPRDQLLLSDFPYIFSKVNQLNTDTFYDPLSAHIDGVRGSELYAAIYNFLLITAYLLVWL